MNKDSPALNSERLCLVVETPDTLCPTARVEPLLSNVRDGSKVVLLWFADSEPDLVVSMIEARGASVELVYGSHLLEKCSQDFETHLPSILKQIHSVVSHPGLWSTRMSEISLGLPVWFELLRVSAIVEELRKGEYKVCLLVASPRIAHMVLEVSSRQGFKVLTERMSKKSVSIFRILGKSLYLRFFNFYIDLWTLLRAASVQFDTEFDTAIFTSFPNNWQFPENRSAYLRYTGSIASSLAARNRKGIYAVTVTRRAMPGLRSKSEIAKLVANARSTKSDMPIHIIEAFGSFWNLLLCYLSFVDALSLLFAWRRCVASGIYWNSLDIAPALQDYFISGALVDLPTNKYLESSFRRLARAAKVDSVMVPGHELVEGRVVCRAAKLLGLRTVGVQHGVHGIAHRWRFHITPSFLSAQPDKGTNLNVPDVVGVEGVPDKQLLERCGFPAGRVVIIGGPRIASHLPKSCIERDHNSKILLMGDLPGPRPPHKPWWSGWYSLMMNEAWSLVVRSHPTVNEQTEEIASQLELETGKPVPRDHVPVLVDGLAEVRPMAVVASVTGAVVETALNGWPVSVVRSNWLPDCNPMTRSQETRVFATSQREELAVWLNRLKDRQYRSTYAQNCFEEAASLVDCGGDEAANRLADILVSMD